MGVQGLLGACLRRQEECCETADLIQEASQLQGIEILVDYNAFEHYILDKVWTKLSRLRWNDYLKIQGGEYLSLRVYLKGFVEALKNKGIQLVFYEDGGKGSSLIGLDLKLKTFINRTTERVSKAADILEVCRGNIDMDQLAEETKIRPQNLEIELMAVLRDCQCEIHHIAVGEADMVIAKALNERGAFAVLTNDSDFCVMKHGRMIPFGLFDIDKDLKDLNLDHSMKRPVSLRKLKVKVITTDKVISMLQLQSHDQLVEMSVAAGNDYTGPYMRSEHLRRERVHIESIANRSRHFKNVEDNPKIRREMRTNPEFLKAVRLSRDFYTLRMDCEDPSREGEYAKILAKRIMSGQYHCFLMGMYNNFYWYGIMLEDNRPGLEFAESVLRPLREHIYRIVLPRQETKVLEMGITPQGNMLKQEVYVRNKEYIPPLNKIEPDEIVTNLRTFHTIMSHLEKGDSPTNWFDRYGHRTGFIVYLLRYFLHLTWDRYIFLTQNECLALVALVFGQPEVSHYQSTPLRPTVRCVTMLNWFQDLYRHAYSLLGGLLHLKDEFPLPSELFSGAVWTSLYMISSDDVEAQQVLWQTLDYRNSVLSEIRDMTRLIAEGFFHYE